MTREKERERERVVDASEALEVNFRPCPYAKLNLKLKTIKARRTLSKSCEQDALI
jgi:hypothetical protein